MPHFDLGVESSPGPTPYLGGEWKQQQQRAGWRRHRAQSLLLQPQHVHKAPLAGNPQPGQHLRRGNKVARLRETSKWWARAGGRGIRCTLNAPAKPGRSPHLSLRLRPVPHLPSAMTQHKARSTRGSREARAPESRGPRHALRSSAGRSTLGVASSSTSIPPPPPCWGQRESVPTAPQPRSSGARTAPLSPCEAAGAGGHLRLGAPGGMGLRQYETPLTLFSIWKTNAKKNTKIKPVSNTATWRGLTLCQVVPGHGAPDAHLGVNLHGFELHLPQPQVKSLPREEEKQR